MDGEIFLIAVITDTPTMLTALYFPDLIAPVEFWMSAATMNQSSGNFEYLDKSETTEKSACMGSFE
jgi:hypothetical protein